MPTTPVKNFIYRRALPIMAPKLEKHPTVTARGEHVHTLKPYTRLLKKHHVLGSATLIAEGDREALLLSSTDEPRHVSAPDTLFRVASITKMVTALCALIACDRGLLALDAPLENVFPEIAGEPSGKITLRHLLSHTAGLLDPPDLEKHLLKGTPFPQLLPKALKHTPGTSFHYSNLGYGLIGCMLEKVTGLPIHAVAEEMVFRPLEMRATLDASSIDEKQIMPISRVLRYHPGQDVTVTELGRIPLNGPDPLRHYGHSAGSMYTDISSLLKLIRCLQVNDGSLLGTGWLYEMKTQHAEYGRISPTLTYGLGLLMIQDPSISSYRIMGHQGFAYGCVDGAFWEENTNRIVITLNGGCSEARKGRLGLYNADMLRLFLRKEFPRWPKSAK